jgi:hypothetical protein
MSDISPSFSLISFFVLFFSVFTFLLIPFFAPLLSDLFSFFSPFYTEHTLLFFLRLKNTL